VTAEKENWPWCGERDRCKLPKAVRASPYINADEIGWREDEPNGYIWEEEIVQAADHRGFKRKIREIKARGGAGDPPQEGVGGRHRYAEVADLRARPSAGRSGLRG